MPTEPVVNEPLVDVVDSVSVLVYVDKPAVALVVPLEPVVREPLVDKVDT